MTRRTQTNGCPLRSPRDPDALLGVLSSSVLLISTAGSAVLRLRVTRRGLLVGPGGRMLLLLLLLVVGPLSIVCLQQHNPHHNQSRAGTPFGCQGLNMFLSKVVEAIPRFVFTKAIPAKLGS